MPTLKSINAAAGTNFRRTAELVEAVMVQWHPQVYRPFAQKDGLTPTDFTWLEYPVSNVRLEHGVGEWNLTYRAEMSPDTPQTNEYFRPEEREEGKSYQEVVFGKETWWELIVTGTALSRVKFQLIDVADFSVLTESNTGHIKGELTAGLAEGRGDLIWKRLMPGTTLQVRLDALPLFFPYVDPETGSGGNEYATGNNGYLGGDLVSSREYALTMTPDGLPEPPHLLIDGQPKPDPAKFQLRGPAEGEAFHEWLSRERQDITAQDAWVTAEIIAGQVGMDTIRYQSIEAGTVMPEDWERHNIEDAIKGWQQQYG